MRFRAVLLLSMIACITVHAGNETEHEENPFAGISMDAMPDISEENFATVLKDMGIDPDADPWGYEESDLAELLEDESAVGTVPGAAAASSAEPEEDNEENHNIVPRRSSRKRSKPVLAAELVEESVDEGDGESEAQLEQPTTKPKRVRKARQAPLTEKEKIALAARSREFRSKRRTQKQVHLGESEELFRKNSELAGEVKNLTVQIETLRKVVIEQASKSR